jgi:hypothetical protein
MQWTLRRASIRPPANGKHFIKQKTTNDHRLTIHQAGIAGYNGWRWIFIIEGILTVCIGLFGYVFVVNFPEQIAKKPAWGFLAPNEVQFLLRRINRDRNDAEAGEFKIKAWAASGADPKIWGFALIFL